MEIALHIEEVEIERRWERLHTLQGRGKVVGRFLSFQNDQTVAWLDALPTGEPAPASPLVHGSKVHTLTPQAGSTIAQLHDFERIRESPVVEIRFYRVFPGMRGRFAAFFRECSLEPLQRYGMAVYGPFDSLDDEDVVVWLRGFPDLLERERRKAAFYQSRLWLEELQDEAFSIIQDYRNNMLVMPVLNGD